MSTITRQPAALGFIGLGWIGRHRLTRLLSEAPVRVAALCDPDPEAIAALGVIRDGARVVESLDELLGCDLDGVVIATPSALHADQAARCLEAGVPVFCQKPLGRCADEVEEVIATARACDRLLDVDLTYRGLPEAQLIRQHLHNEDIGRVFGVELVFHNAYGPQSGWFTDYEQSGGGCLADLGVHLVDLAMWSLGWPQVSSVEGLRYRKGRMIAPNKRICEDYAVGQITIAHGPVVRLACSWGISEGADARIEATFYGTEGALHLGNVDGSFISFQAERRRGTEREVLSTTREDFSDWRWGANRAVRWAKRLATDRGHAPEIERVGDVARLLDRLYGREQHVVARVPGAAAIGGAVEGRP